MPREDDPRNAYGALAWAPRYLLDWRGCGPHVTHIRAFTTCIRWFDDPVVRASQLSVALLYVRPENRITDPQHLLNLSDLLDSDIEIPMDLDYARLGLFFAALGDGDIISGGPVRTDEGRVLSQWRGGFGWLWETWFRFFPNEAPPWPFWIWPRTGLTVQA